MAKHTEFVKLLGIYREMDAEGRKKMLAAATSLLNTQKTLFDLDSKKHHSPHISGYLVTGGLLLMAACVFWITLINPALLTAEISPMVMLRVIATALLGMLCLGTGLIQFILRKLKIPWVLLAVCAGILCVDPRVLTDFMGLFLIILIICVRIIIGKQEKTAITASAL